MPQYPGFAILTVPFILLSVATFKDTGNCDDSDDVSCNVRVEKLGECQGWSVAEDEFIA